MQELRLVMIVIGAVAIVALLIHGLWTSRRERPEKFSERPIQKVVEQDNDGFDQNGVGSVRVVANPASENQDNSQDPLFLDANTAPAPEQPVIAETATTNSAKVKPVKDFYHFEDTEEDIALAQEEQTLLEQQQPVEDSPLAAQAEHAAEATEEPVSAPEPVREEKVLVLNVQAPANQEFRGDDLFNCLEQYGMQFGEMDIFHCHAAENPQKIIFSAANMINPGTFSISGVHQFSTPGITLFMMLPCYGEPDQNFKLMLKTAQQVADLLGGHVTDDSRNLLTPKRLDDYRDMIKAFMAPA